MDSITVSYKDGLKEALTNPDEAAAYLNAALAENDQAVFLLALRDIAEAKGFTQISEESNLNRENLYRMLSTIGNPQLVSLNAILQSIGLRLAIEVASR